MSDNFDLDAYTAEFAGDENITELNNAFKAAEAAAKCAGKDKVAYVATVDGVATFEVVVSGRTVLRALVNEDAEAPMPAGIQVPAGVKCHAIMISTPDGKTVIPTNGRTFTLPGRSHSEGSVVRSYVKTRITRFLVQAYALGL
jgi:hypothetical protein